MTDQAGPVFSALSDPTRRTVVEALASRETATATELASELPVTRQAVSKHLTALGSAGLVAAERRGRETHYRLTPAALSQALLVDGAGRLAVGEAARGAALTLP